MNTNLHVPFNRVRLAGIALTVSALAALACLPVAGVDGQDKAAAEASDTVAAAAAAGADNNDSSNFERTVRGAVHDAQNLVTHAARVGKAVAYGLASSGRPSVVVLPGTGLSSDAVESMSEDLTVMSRIFEKAAGHPENEQRAWFTPYAPMFRRTPDAMYLEGFGALFMLNVDYPLVAPAKVKAAKAPEPSDSTWEDTKRELHGSTRGTLRGFGWAGRPGEDVVEFDETRVEDLKQELAAACKHAANLRGMRADETIAVTVFGPAPKDSGKGGESKGKGNRRLGESTVYLYSEDAALNVVGGDLPEGRAGSVLTLRVKKSDVDAFAKGKLSGEEFGKKVAVSAR